MRIVFGVLAGIVSGFIVIVLMEQAGILIYPRPADFDVEDKIKLKLFMEDLPVGAYLFLIFGYGLASLVGGLVAGFVSYVYRFRSALIVGFLLLIGGCINFFYLLPYHPPWVTVSTLCCYIPTAMLGALTSRGWRPDRAPDKPYSAQ